MIVSAARVLTLTTAAVLVVGGIEELSLSQSGEASSAPRHHIVQIRQLQFQPAEVSVAPGDTVTWVNRDIVPHTVTAIGTDWNSGELANGASWQWTVRADTSVTYYCEYHPTMQGRLIVK